MTRKLPVLSCFAMLLLAAALPAGAQDKPACNVEQTRQDMKLMMERDFSVRVNLVTALRDAEEKKGGKLTQQEVMPLADELMCSDKLNQDELDRIVAECGWPTRASLGAEPVRIAGRIMIHAPAEFVRKHYDQMWASYQAGEASPLRMATVIDELLIDEGKPQRYGTRDDDLNADGKASVVEDPAHLEERRRAFGIPAVKLPNDID